jgi:hypothetical protein
VVQPTLPRRHDVHRLPVVLADVGDVEQLRGVVEGLDTRQPRLIPDRSWSAWFTEEARAERVRAEAMRQWSHRGETVADRALAEGGQA